MQVVVKKKIKLALKICLFKDEQLFCDIRTSVCVHGEAHFSCEKTLKYADKMLP